MNESGKKKKKKNKYGNSEYQFLCCFNPDWCCGWYKPRVIFVQLIILLTLVQAFIWVMEYCFYFMANPRNPEVVLSYFWIFNPFLKFDKPDDDRQQ